MSRTIGGLPLKQVLGMAPEWATHIATAAHRPDTFIFESEEFFQVYNEGLGSKLEQGEMSMQEDGVLISTLIEELNNEC